MENKNTVVLNRKPSKEMIAASAELIEYYSGFDIKKLSDILKQKNGKSKETITKAFNEKGNVENIQQLEQEYEGPEQ